MELLNYHQSYEEFPAQTTHNVAKQNNQSVAFEILINLSVE